MAGRFSVEAVFKAIDRITGPVRGMQRSVTRFTTRVESRLRRVGRAADMVSAGLKRIGAATVLAAAVAVPAFADIIRTGAEFEQSLVSAGAKFPQIARKGTEAFKQLETAARDVGRTTEFTASQAAQGLGFLAMAGFDAQQAMAALPGLVDLATVSELELARASDIASDTLGAFGLMTKDTAQLTKNLTRVNDVLARTVTSSNTDMEMLFETIKGAGPVAADAGASIENFAALAGIMANSGIKASQSATALKNIFVRLQAPPTEAAKAMAKLGISTANAEGSFVGVNSVMEQLLKKLPAVGKVQRAQALSAIFGLRAVAGSNVVLSQGVEFLEQYQKNLEGATGASKEMAAEIRGSTLNNLRTLGSAVESVKLSIFSMTEGPLNDLITRMTDWIRQNEKLIAQGLSEWIVKVLTNLPEIVSWLGKIGKGIIAFVAFTAAVNALQGAFALFNIVMAANPIVLITLGALAAAAAIVFLISKSDQLVAKFEGMAPALRMALAPLELIVRAMKFIKDGHAFLTEGAAGIVESVLPKLGIEAPERSTLFSGGGDAQQPEGESISSRLLGSFKDALQKQESEVTIKDETGRAEVTNGGGPGLKLERTGEM